MDSRQSCLWIKDVTSSTSMNTVGSCQQGHPSLLTISDIFPISMQPQVLLANFPAFTIAFLTFCLLSLLGFFVTYLKKKICLLLHFVKSHDWQNTSPTLRKFSVILEQCDTLSRLGSNKSFCRCCRSLPFQLDKTLKVIATSAT